MKQFNNSGLGCQCFVASYHPPHCRGVANGIIPEGFTVPCGRGDTESGKLFKLILYLMPVTIVPFIIVGTMLAMFRSVRKVERKMLKYGASVLQLRATSQRQEAQDPNSATRRGKQTSSPSILIKILSIRPCVFRNSYGASRSNNARSQRRAIFYMAMSYSLTWVLIWIPLYILLFVINNNATRVMNGILHPLQGLYNLIVYLSPKVRNARNTKRGKLPWRQAIAKAWISKGKEDHRRAVVVRGHSINASMWQRFQNVSSRFMNRRNKRFSAALAISKARVSDGASTIQSPLTVQQNQPKNTDPTTGTEL